MASSRSLGTLTLDLVTKTVGFTGPLDKAGRDANKTFQNLERRAKQFGKILGTAIVAGATAVTVALRQSINAMDDMSKAAQRAQLPTEQFSQLAYAGSLADVAMEDITKSMGRLAKAQGDAARGLTEQVAGFKALDIEFKNADGSLRSTHDVFLDFADAFQKHRGSPEVMALGMQVFGRSFQNLIPLLKDGRAGLEAAADEADRLGITLSTEAGQQAEQFNDNLTRLKTAVFGLTQSLAAELLPDLVRVTDEFVETATEGDRLANTVRGIGNAIRDAMDFVLDFHDRLVILRNTMAQLELQAQGFSPAAGLRSLLDGGEYMAPYEAMVKRKQELAIEAEAARARILGRSSPFARVSGSTSSSANDLPDPGQLTIAAPSKSGGGGKSEADKEADRVKAAYDSLNERLREQIALFGETSEAAQVLYDIKNGELAKLAPRQQQELLGLAEKLDMMNEEKKVQDELNRINEQQEEAYQRVAESIDEARLMVGMTREEQEIWNNLAWAGVDAESARGQAIIENTRLLQEQREVMSDQIEFMDGLRDAGRGFMDDLKEGVGIWDSLSNAAGRFADKLFEMSQDHILDSLFGKQGEGSGGSTQGWLGALMGIFGGARANGGPVSPGMFYEVGEQDRPELLSARNGKQYLIPGNQGTVQPMGRGGTQMVNNFQFSAPTTMKTQTQMANRLSFEQRRAARVTG